MIIIFKRALLIFFLSLPLLSFSLNAISWLRYGIDLPLYDDWRGYASGKMHSLDWGYLFQPVNDTLTPIGFALDALAQRYLDGNSIAYQFLSMVIVLGSLLFLQWKLLLKTLNNSYHAAVCFSFTLLMLQPGSYWGQQNMAYHQALPLIFILCCVWFILNEKLSNFWRLILISIFGSLAGFSYISGAFCVLAAGLAVIAISRVYINIQRNILFNSGVVLLLSGVLSSWVQYSKALLAPDAHGTNTIIATPFEMNFWWYFFGKIGRSLALPVGYSNTSQIVVIIVCIVTGYLAGNAGLRGQKWRLSNGSIHPVGVVFFIMTSVVFFYLCIISAGRLNFKSINTQTADQIFTYGFERFHFFWATLLWPWMLAAGIIFWRRFKYTNLLATMFSVIFIVIFFQNGGFSHSENYKSQMQYRLSTISCLLEKLQQDGDIDCPEFFISDFRPLYAYALKMDASFIKNFPILPKFKENETPSDLLFLTNDFSSADFQGIEKNDFGNRFQFKAKKDSSITLKIEKISELSQCKILEIDAKIQTEYFDIAQVFFQNPEDLVFKESKSKILPMQSDAVQNLSFVLYSSKGFANIIRLDPVEESQNFSIFQISIRCRFFISEKNYANFRLP